MTNSKEQPESCLDSTEKETPTEKAVEYFEKRGRQKLHLGMIANEKLQDEADRQRNSQAHQERAARQAMGWDDSPIEGEGEEVSQRQTVLGDFNQQPPPPPTIVYPPTAPERKPILGTVLATALAVGLPGAGALGYGIAKMVGDKAETVIIEKGKDTATSLGLKRFKDLNLRE